MRIGMQRRLAASVLGCSEKRVWMDSAKAQEIKAAVTKTDIRSLIKQGIIRKKNVKGISRGRIRKNMLQKQKGRQRGVGHRKGKKTARTEKKLSWMQRIRLQRGILKELKTGKRIDTEVYRMMYKRAKGGFFRSKRHMNLYLEDNKLLRK